MADTMSPRMPVLSQADLDQVAAVRIRYFASHTRDAARDLTRPHLNR